MRRTVLKTAWAWSAAAMLCACTPSSDTPTPSISTQALAPVFHAEANPIHLSDWGLLSTERGHLIPSDGTVHYAVNAPLFTDYAHKLRTIYTPEPAAIGPNGDLDYAVGTVISKTFYYPVDGDAVVRTADTQSDAIVLTTHRLIETRLLVHRTSGWDAVSYVWNEDQTEAQLKRTGAVIPLTMTGIPNAIDLAYVVPNENQCAGCHASNATTKAMHPLGATAPQFKDRSAMVVGGVMRAGVFTPQLDYANEEAALSDRARSYLAANCAHCHNPVGPADTSGLDLSLTAKDPIALGRCKPPIAAGSGTGGHQFSIQPGDPDRSILAYRMASTDPGAMMPELGRSLVHDEGVALIRGWIAAQSGSCS